MRPALEVEGKMFRRGLIVVALLSMLGLGVLTTSAQSTEHYYCTQYYTVQRGDWLSSIARRFGTTWQAIANLNGIRHPNLIYAGQVLCVRAGYVPPVGNTYVVQPGDRLFRIGLRFGIPWTSIAAANNIYNPNLIYPGQVLVIPPY
jgi:LysM repeat protein